MILTEGQNQALEMAKRIANSRLGRPAIGVLAGPAGTGKSSMIKFISQELGHIVLIAPTGKAALRITELSGLPAQTIHRYMYKPNSDVLTGEVNFTLKPIEEIECPRSKLIIIDEASMVGLDIWEGIYEVCSKIGCNILAVGDPFQLPPVQDKIGENFSLLSPEFNYDERVLLTEILRQSLDSPIIRISMEIRNGDPYKALMQFPKEWRIFDKDLYSKMDEVLNDKGVIICHTNKTRHLINKKIRTKRGLGNEVQQGEPLLVLKNNYQVEMYNGEITALDRWEFLDQRDYDLYDYWSKERAKSRFGRAKVGGRTVALTVNEIFGNMEKFNTAAIDKVAKHSCGTGIPVLHCNFGYCLSCHKSQGSEFPKVLAVIEPTVNLGSTDGRRFIYTLITRSKEACYLSWNPDLQAI